MRKNPSVLTVFFLLLLFYASFLATGNSLGAGRKLTPKAQATIKKENDSFKKCRFNATKRLKSGQFSETEFKTQIANCQDSFPGANLYIACKKAITKKLGKKPTGGQIKEAIAKCNNLLLSTTFNKNSPLPFFMFKKKLFFSGIGLNNPIPAAKADSLPNFDCSGTDELMQSPEKAEYFLFGNHPKVFSPFRNKDKKELASILKLPKQPDINGHYVKGLGKIFGTLNKESSVYFPTGTCVFDSELGDIFSGLTAYYLIDSEEKTLVPYFGIAFFKPTYKERTVNQLATQMSKIFDQGEAGTFNVQQDDQKFTFLSTQPLKHFDEEGDPRDICANPRPHVFISAIKSRSEEKEYPEYIMVANIKNLCEYGDTVTQRFFSQ